MHSASNEQSDANNRGVKPKASFSVGFIIFIYTTWTSLLGSLAFLMAVYILCNSNYLGFKDLINSASYASTSLSSNIE